MIAPQQMDDVSGGPLRILQVHNYYGSSAPSGENGVVDLERAVLLEAGHDVRLFSRHSDTIRAQGALGLLKGAVSTPWNKAAADDLCQQVAGFQPAIVHTHNTFPLISPAIFKALRGKAARVLTLHNYRLFCPAGIPMREEKVCTLCLDRHSAWPALRHGCYRNSRLATAPLALTVELHRRIGTWANEVDAFIVLSEFQKELMAEAGLPADKLHVKPNFYTGNPSVTDWGDRSGEIVFVGRLSREKGVHTLLEAWRHWGADAPRLKLFGDGDDREELMRQSVGLPIEFAGQVSPKEAVAAIANARLMVLPSEWFEGFPMVIAEAFAHGTPIAASEIGPLDTIVRTAGAGTSFPAANARVMQARIAELWSDQAALARCSSNARTAFEQHFTAEATVSRLREIYAAAQEESRKCSSS
ncbi:glycosyltransferase family 4 protein [Parerythrobacter aestuarii]|uniref:glycosyltransferase family 4 protein n=1 Tax=Parerythrobacter aestuarii TaxID=3020909 RepID=UPI0024DEE11D|nr:glycosyltransferase family 4 protein [Parerythrobacter aestuarii]